MGAENEIAVREQGEGKARIRGDSKKISSGGKTQSLECHYKTWGGNQGDMARKERSKKLGRGVRAATVTT